jgi:hypothetical protein
MTPCAAIRASSSIALIACLMLACAARAADADPPAAADEDGETPQATPTTGPTAEERARLYYERVIRKIEPSLQGDERRLPEYLDFFKRQFVEDPRTVACELTASGPGTEPGVLGFVEFAEHKQTLADMLKHMGLADVRDQIEQLPAENLGEKLYGLVTSPRAYVYDLPRGEIRRLTECATGDVVFILKEIDGQFLCHVPDGYVGYIASENIRRVNDAQLDALEAVVPVGPSSQIEQVIGEAMTLVGTPYVWGGGSKHGVDCSGLVRRAFRAAAISMPRDADQQSLVGRLVAMRWYRRGLRRGDTLYFLGRHGTISHTALYLGENKYIEATEPVARISSFDPDAPEYVEKRAKSFCFAKRVLE